MLPRPLFRSFVKCQASVAAVTRRFSSATEGVAAVEFALIVPIMAALMIGTIEMSEAITVDRRVSIVSATVGDLAARKEGDVTPSEISGISRIGSWLLDPYPINPIKIFVRLVKVECISGTCANGAKVPVSYAGQKFRWSCTYDPIASGLAEKTAFPTDPNAETRGQRDASSICVCQDTAFVAPSAGLLEFGTSPSLVVSEAQYLYTPRFFNVFMQRAYGGAGVYTLSETRYHKPRGGQIIMKGATGTPNTQCTNS